MALRTFAKRFPEVSLDAITGSTSELLSALREDQATSPSYTNYTDGPDSGAVRFELVYREPLALAIPDDHPLVGHDALGAEDLVGASMILLPRSIEPLNEHLGEGPAWLRRCPPARHPRGDHLGKHLQHGRGRARRGLRPSIDRADHRGPRCRPPAVRCAGTGARAQRGLALQAVLDRRPVLVDVAMELAVVLDAGHQPHLLPLIDEVTSEIGNGQADPEVSPEELAAPVSHSTTPCPDGD